MPSNLPEITLAGLFTRKFYLYSIIANIISLSGGFFLFSDSSSAYLLSVLMCIDGYLLIELICRKHLADVQSRLINRYTVQVLVGMCAAIITVSDITNPVILYVPPMLFIIYSAFNGIIHSKLVTYAKYIMLVSGFVIVLMKPNTNQNLLLYIFVIFMMIAVTTLSKMLYTAQIKETHDRLQFANSVSLIYDMVFSLLRHDINNQLACMQLLSMPKYRNDEDLFLETQQFHYDKLESILKTTKMNTREMIDLNDIIDEVTTQVTRQASIGITYLTDVSEVNTTRSMLIPTIKNIIDNSLEAARLRDVSPEITIVVDGHFISFDDNCGGFDVADIAYGKSSKVGTGHGIFLKTITSPCMKQLFGFIVTVERIPNGTRHVIDFT